MGPERTLQQVFWDAFISHAAPTQFRLGVDETHRPVRMRPAERARGLYIIGHPGQGKTTLVQNLMLQDMAEGNGLIFLTSEEETFTERLLPFVPEHRVSDVVYINPRDTSRPVAFNPLHVGAGEDFEQKRSQTTTILRRVFAESSASPAPRMDMIVSHAVSTLMQLPGSTLEDIPRLVDPYDASFRQWAAERIHDERDRAFWTEPSLYARFPKDAHLPLMVRLEPLLRTSSVRALLCTPGHSFNLRAAMDEGKIVLVNLADGMLGAQEASVIGQLIVSQLQLATMSRAQIPEEKRRPFYAYLDEFQKFCNTDSVSYLEMLARGRRYRVPLILAHQETGQIPDAIMRGIFGTVSTIAAFTISHADAVRLAKEMRIEEPFALQDQPVGQCHCRLDRRTFVLKTDPPPKGGSSERAEEIIRRSRERYGVAWSEARVRPTPPVMRAAQVEQTPPQEVPPVAPAPSHGAPPPAPSVELTSPQSDPGPQPTAAAPSASVPSPEMLRVTVAPSTPASNPGRGGKQHKYLQTLISRWADANDWRSTVEEDVLGGLGRVDVALRKGERSIACEIGVTTPAEHELGNIQKCLTAGFEHVVHISLEKRARNRMKSLVASELDDGQSARVSVCLAEEMIEVLDALDAAAPASEQTVRGYKVRVRFAKSKPQEKEEKRGVVSAVIAKAMKRIRGGKSK